MTAPRPVEPCPGASSTLVAAAGLGMDAIDAIRELERRIDRPKEPCPGAGMVVMRDPHPDLPGKYLFRCPVCSQVVVFGEPLLTPHHDREVARG